MVAYEYRGRERERKRKKNTIKKLIGAIDHIYDITRTDSSSCSQVSLLPSNFWTYSWVRQREREAQTKSSSGRSIILYTGIWYHTTDSSISSCSQASPLPSNFLTTPPTTEASLSFALLYSKSLCSLVSKARYIVVCHKNDKKRQNTTRETSHTIHSRANHTRWRHCTGAGVSVQPYIPTAVFTYSEVWHYTVSSYLVFSTKKRCKSELIQESIHPSCYNSTYRCYRYSQPPSPQGLLYNSPVVT